jgi:hypothetical protein
MSMQPVVVVGAGAAGMSAALAAARAGSRVVLLEAQRCVGGTVTTAQIHTLAGLYDSAGQLINGGLAQELAQRLFAEDCLARRRRMGRVWVLNVRPEVYGEAVGRWLAAEPRIEVVCRATVTKMIRRGPRVVELEASTPRGVVRLRPRAVIDATGTAEAVRRLDQNLLDAASPRAAGGWIFRLRGVSSAALNLPGKLAALRLIREAVSAGDLPPECDKTWLDAGVYEDEVFVKLFVPLDDRWQSEPQLSAIAAQADETRAAVLMLLRQLPAFAQARVTHTGSLGVRDGGGILGEYRLTRSDVLEARKFEDAACRACWPVEYWDPQSGVSLTYLPEDDWYEIPLRSLQVAGMQNLWAAGKCLSADKYAQASARVVGTCWAMGEAAGRAAASCLRHNLLHSA